jgi:hypothetical protein
MIWQKRKGILKHWNEIGNRVNRLDQPYSDKTRQMSK